MLQRFRRRLSDWICYWLPTGIMGVALTLLAQLGRRRPVTEPAAIALILIEHMGDVIVTTPLIRALRMHFSGSRIIVMTSAVGASWLQHCPYIDQLIKVEAAPSWKAKLSRAFRLAALIRKMSVQWAIVPKDAYNKDFNELICMAAGCQRRISRARSEWVYRIKPLKFGPFYNEIVSGEDVKHEAESRLEIAHYLGATPSSPPRLEYWLSNEDLNYAEQFYAKHNNPPRSLIVAFGVGASSGNRCWSAERYAEVINALCASLNIFPLIVLAPHEVPLAKRIAAQALIPVNYAMGASVRQSLALLQRADIFVGNDSGPMHMAAALGLPVVEISSHPQGANPRSINSPERFGPYGVIKKVLRPEAMSIDCAGGCISETEAHCITRITSVRVVEAVMQLLQEAGIPAPSSN